MAMMFTIIGDSNVKRHMNPMSCRDRPLMSSAQVLQCGRLEVLAEAIKQINAEATICIFSCVTNFLTSVDGASNVSLRVEPIFLDFLAKIESLRTTRPDLKCLICPPMYRESPIWYRDNLSQIMMKFSEVFSRSQSGILLMPSFARPDLESDGVHLTAYSGLEFALYLFDSARVTIETAESTVEEKSSKSTESNRLLEDRVMALEQDHRRLNKFVEWKTAVDSELADFHENLRNERWFVIAGLARLDSKMDKKDWQVKAKSDVNGILSILMGHEYPIVVVQNITSPAKDSICRYQVLMTTLSDSKEIRDKFGVFFTGGKGDQHPDSLKHVSIQNRLTPGTQLRLALLKLQAKRYLASNPGGQAYVIGYDARPLIKIVPPEDATDRRIKTFSYIDAIQNLPVNFSSAELRPILEKVNGKLKGTLKQFFVVVSDDMLPSSKFKGKGKGPSGSGGSSGGGSSAQSESSGRGHKRGPSVSPSDASKGSKNSKSSKGSRT